VHYHPASQIVQFQYSVTLKTIELFVYLSVSEIYIIITISSIKTKKSALKAKKLKKSA